MPRPSVIFSLDIFGTSLTAGIKRIFTEVCALLYYPLREYPEGIRRLPSESASLESVATLLLKRDAW